MCTDVNNNIKKNIIYYITSTCRGYTLVAIYHTIGEHTRYHTYYILLKYTIVVLFGIHYIYGYGIYYNIIYI